MLFFLFCFGITAPIVADILIPFNTNVTKNIISRIRPALVSITGTKKSLNPRQLQLKIASPNQWNVSLEHPHLALNFSGSTTGLMISDDGLILSNANSLRDFESIFVTLADGRQYPAAPLGTDIKSQLTLLKINDIYLPHYPLDLDEYIPSSSQIYSVSLPFGISKTQKIEKWNIVSSNIVIRNKSFEAGNILLNEFGEFVGFGFQLNLVSDLNFLTGASDAKFSYTKAKQLYLASIPGWLGIFIRPVTPEFKLRFDISGNSGAQVADILPNSPALKADIRENDVIAMFNGVTINAYDELPPLVEKARILDKVEVLLHRDQNGVTLALTTTIDVNIIEPKNYRKEYRNNWYSKLGFLVEELTDEFKNSYAYPIEAGVVTSYVKPASLAWESGIREGDIILYIQSRPIHSVANFKKAVRPLKKGDFVPVAVDSQGQSNLVIVKVEK